MKLVQPDRACVHVYVSVSICAFVSVFPLCLQGPCRQPVLISLPMVADWAGNFLALQGTSVLCLVLVYHWT